MKKRLVLLVLSLAFLRLNAQIGTNQEITRPVFNAGIGIGIDYGGFGGRLTYLVAEKFGLFGALGYNLLGVGFNAGGIYRFLPKSNYCPYLGAMYGYNAVLKVEGGDQYNQIYYGPSFTLGLEIWQKMKPNYFNVEFIVPIRSSEFKSDVDNPNIELKTEPIPVAFSIGYHIGF
jgi:hypothetical protein